MLNTKLSVCSSLYIDALCYIFVCELAVILLHLGNIQINKMVVSLKVLMDP